MSDIGQSRNFQLALLESRLKAAYNLLGEIRTMEILQEDEEIAGHLVWSLDTAIDCIEDVMDCYGFRDPNIRINFL